MGYKTKTRKTSTYGAIMIMPHACQGDRRRFAGPAGSTGSVRGRAMVDTSLSLDANTLSRGSGNPVAFHQPTLDSRRRGSDVREARFLLRSSFFHRTHQPATALMRAIISSTALSTGTFSLTMRFIAFAQTFSLLMIVNL